MMGRDRLRLAVLDLVGTVRRPDTTEFTQEDWAELDAIAAQHRLRPLLHIQHRDCLQIPAVIRDNWAQAFRFQAIQSLRQQADLITIARMLRQRGFTALALKGAWLSRFAYPQAGMRPLRDIDLLLDQDTVIPAYNLLLEAGYRPAQPTELSLEDTLRLEKHMPPLLTPGGTVVELHHRLWEPDGRMDHASPAEIDDAVRRAAIMEKDGLTYPDPIDMLAHLIAHAIYSHRLDCGPLLLADIDYLLLARKIDWTSFWKRSRQEGWRDGARLVLELVVAHRSGAAVDFSEDRGEEVPAEILANAPHLLLQDLAMRKSAGVVATIRKQGTRGLLNRMMGKREAVAAPSAQREMSVEGGFLNWASSRLMRTASDLSHAEVRQQARNLSLLSDWLDRS